MAAGRSLGRGLGELEGATGAIDSYRFEVFPGTGLPDGVEALELWDVDAVENSFKPVLGRTMSLEGLEIYRGSSCG